MKRIRFLLGAALMSLSAILAAPAAQAAASSSSDPVIFCIEAPGGYIVIVFVDGAPVREFFSETCPIL